MAKSQNAPIALKGTSVSIMPKVETSMVIKDNVSRDWTGIRQKFPTQLEEHLAQSCREMAWCIDFLENRDFTEEMELITLAQVIIEGIMDRIRSLRETTADEIGALAIDW